MVQSSENVLNLIVVMHIVNILKTTELYRWIRW